MGRTCGTHGSFAVTYGVLVRDLSETLKCRWEDNIKMDLQQVG